MEPKPSGKIRKKNSGAANLIPGYKAPKKQRELVEACREMTQDTLAVIEGIMRDADSKNCDRLEAAKLILAYGHGKPAQALDLNVSGGVSLVMDV